MYTNINFDEINLTNITNVNFNNLRTDSMPDVVMSKDKLARQDGIKIFNKEYGSKNITLEGYITASDRNGYLVARDTLIKYTLPREKILQLPMDGTPLEYTATCQNIMFSDSEGGYARFSIEFLCSDPFGYDRDVRVLLDAVSNTATPYEFTFAESIGGTYKTPAVFTIQFNALTGGTSKVVQLKSEAGESIYITRTWTTGDHLEIDMKYKTVKVNGILTDYTGVFWFLRVDESHVTYIDTLTTRTVSMTATYKRRSL